MIHPSIKKAALIAAAAAVALPLSQCRAQAQQLTGAGSTFVNPIMTKWIAAYRAKTGTSVNYQAIGSGGGITALIDHTVNFAGSDVPMTSDELSEAKAPVLEIPDVVGAVTVAYDVPGIGPGIRLTGPVLADIYLGKITRWNDPQITRLNPGTRFPNAAIFVAHRSDGSGTTAIFTDYLSKVSPAWKNGPGTGKSIDWPVGLGGKGNAGVAGLLTAHRDSIGYVELAYSVQNDIPYALVRNAHGKFIYPSVASAASAAAAVKVGPGLTASLTGTSSADGYPITGFSYLIVYRSTPKANDLKRFLAFVVGPGQSAAYLKPLFYSRVPASVCARADKEIGSIR